MALKEWKGELMEDGVIKWIITWMNARIIKLMAECNCFYPINELLWNVNTCSATIVTKHLMNYYCFTYLWRGVLPTRRHHSAVTSGGRCDDHGRGCWRRRRRCGAALCTGGAARSGGRFLLRTLRTRSRLVALKVRQRFKIMIDKHNHTRMHSSSMRTVRNRSRVGGRGLLRGGVCSRGCLLRGCLLQGGLLREGVPGPGIPACTEADPPVDRMTDTCKNITFATSLQTVKIRTMDLNSYDCRLLDMQI